MITNLYLITNLTISEIKDQYTAEMLEFADCHDFTFSLKAVHAGCAPYNLSTYLQDFAFSVLNIVVLLLIPLASGARPV